MRLILESTATDLGPRGRDRQFGWGLVNPARALAMVEQRKRRARVPRRRRDAGAALSGAFEAAIGGGAMVLPDRIELSTSPLPMECSTTELRQHRNEASAYPINLPMSRVAGSPPARLSLHDD